MCASRAIDHFLDPVVSKTEWNQFYQFKSQRPAHSGII